MAYDLTTLTPDDHKAIEESVNRTLSLESFFRVEPNGHTEYQLRNFLAPHKDCPTPDMKYRQYCRELWARVEAFQGAKFGIMEARIDAERLKHPWWHLPSYLAYRSGLRDVARQKAEYREAILRLDMKQRIVREMRVVLDVLKGFDQQAMERDRMKAEAANWAKKAESIPELAAILNTPPATAGSRNGA